MIFSQKAARLKRDRLINTHVLVVLNQQNKKLDEFIEGYCLDSYEVEDVRRYLPVRINDVDVAKEMNRGFLADHDWVMPGVNEFKLSFTPSSMRRGT